MKTGLVLEGGAMRGLFTAGILDVLMEQGIDFDGLIGVSAGAAFGCNFKSRQVGRCIRYNKRFAKDWRYCSLRSLLLTGDLFGGEFCYHRMPKELDIFDVKAFDANPMAFYAVCTDVETGKPVYKLIDKANDEAYEWLRASASMPMVSKVVEVGGHRLLDGGISDSIPLKFFQRIGYERNIVVLTQPAHYTKQRSRWFPLMRWLMRRVPAISDAMARRPEMYNAELAYIEQAMEQGNTLVVCPDAPLKIGRISKNPDDMQATYELGRHMAERRMADIRAFMAASK